jgi:hypothetical protein
MRIKNINIRDAELSEGEQFYIVCDYVRKRPDVVKILLENPKASCPFPQECNKFPCKTLRCNADVCSNGHAYRMS